MIIKGKAFECIEILSQVSDTINQMIGESTPEVDQLFGTVSQYIIELIRKIKNFTREIFIIERYITCEKIRKLYKSPEELPEEVKEQAIKYRGEDDICLFTLEVCTCDKDPETLLRKMNLFLETMGKRRERSSSIGKNLSTSLNKIKGEFDNFSSNISKIVEIAEKVDLIAINAYVEAARMGEGGKGFEIIAENIRKAALEIQDLGREINLGYGELEIAFNENVEIFKNFRDHEEQSKTDDHKATEKIKEEILNLVNNFVKFIEYTSNFSRDIFDEIQHIQQEITVKLQYVDINNQKIQNIGKRFFILIEMVEALLSFFNDKISEDELYDKFKETEDKFKKVATVFSESEIISENLDYDISEHMETVGEKLDDTEGDVELF